MIGDWEGRIRVRAIGRRKRFSWSVGSRRWENAQLIYFLYLLFLCRLSCFRAICCKTVSRERALLFKLLLPKGRHYQPLVVLSLFRYWSVGWGISRSRKCVYNYITSILIHSPFSKSWATTGCSFPSHILYYLRIHASSNNLAWCHKLL